ncbi:hypothetical protein D3C72_2282430 [compost metagenome]
MLPLKNQVSAPLTVFWLSFFSVLPSITTRSASGLARAKLAKEPRPIVMGAS